MDDVVIPWASGGNQMAHDHLLTPLFTFLTLVNLFIKLKINILPLPPLAKYCFLLVPMQLLYAHMFGRI